ncbi:NUDIX domain-containing protein [Patescibacteria group bacterium]|nr:NUDIX domain-containing protein [Patescibacteria group bacterium]MBU4274737.1 NUDIX domain-containing protein [Patescibacteria group bacterium]MBU4367819.1 NUDIX domain-containing protein [Patescibacteria group bacterium]MBU4461529.1 NUDIX domain-containing protein [Patescibacteria group bacterium]MCG2700330.1 NUDIX domain-containing protein [Candidatus Parcubacteria bacterium]
MSPKTKTENPKPEKNKYCVIVNGVVVKDGKILLAQRSAEEKHVPGRWSPPGGKLERTGTVWHALEKTVKKEILEETGVEVEDEMQPLINNTFQHEEDDLLVLANVFLCKYKSGEPEPLEDTTAVRWVGEDEINNYEFTHSNVKNYIIKAFEFLRNHHWQ